MDPTAESRGAGEWFGPMNEDTVDPPDGALARPPTVLLVDDEVDIVESLAELIESMSENVRVLKARSGKEGLEILGRETVDIIVTDYKMPGMSGLEFLAEARRIAPNVPRILITAFPDLELAVKAINQEHIENFLTKPLDPATVVETIEGVVRQRRHELQRQRAIAAGLAAMKKRKRSDGESD